MKLLAVLGLSLVVIASGCRKHSVDTTDLTGAFKVLKPLSALADDPCPLLWPKDMGQFQQGRPINILPEGTIVGIDRLEISNYDFEDRGVAVIIRVVAGSDDGKRMAIQFGTSLLIEAAETNGTTLHPRLNPEFFQRLEQSH